MLLPIRSSSMDLFLLSFFFLSEISSFWRTSIALSPFGTQSTSEPRGVEVFVWFIFSDFLPLNDTDIPTLLHCSSLDISVALSSLAHDRCFRTWVFDHLSILPTIPLSPVFCPNERPFFIFPKARWNDFAYYFSLSFCRGILVSFLCCCCSFYFSWH